MEIINIENNEVKVYCYCNITNTLDRVVNLTTEVTTLFAEGFKITLNKVEF